MAKTKTKASKPKSSGGRPPYAPTDKDRDFVKAMTMAGVQEGEIAKVLKISEKTLRKYYRQELDTAMTMANASVVAALFKQATGNGPGAVTAAIFWAKTRLGWKEPPQGVELSNAPGEIFKTEDVSAVDRIRSQLARIAARAGAGEDPQEPDAEAG